MAAVMASGGSVGFNFSNAARNRGTSTTSPLVSRPSNPTSHGSPTPPAVVGGPANSETVLLRARAWLAVTSANPTFGGDAGLADRLLVVRMARRDTETSDAALGDEIRANRDAEADKSRFCLENDTVGSALLQLFEAGSFSGTTAALTEKLIEVAPDLRERLTPTRLGRRLSNIWPHLSKVCRVAERERRRQATEYRFELSCGMCGISEADFPTPPS